jgi:hypothetical protein
MVGLREWSDRPEEDEPRRAKPRQQFRRVIGAVALIVLGAIILSGCGESAAPEAPSGRFVTVKPDSGVNVWTEIEIEASDFSDAPIIGEIDRLMRGLASDISAGRVTAGADVLHVQALIFVTSPDYERQKLGSIRFPLADFLSSGGDLNAADFVQLREYGAAEPFCRDPAHAEANFCLLFASGAT